MNWSILGRRNGKPRKSNGHIIEMEGLAKVYDTGKVKVNALNGITFSVKKGEFVAVIGPSGSGKSTLMNLIGCLDTPTSGDYVLAGDDVAGLDRDRLAEVRNKRVGFVFQNFNLLPQITALENVEMPMLFAGVPARERRKRATELLNKLGLGERLQHKPTELSGGQMQRVAIARALAMNPDVILADEPTGNLDSSAGSDVLSLLIELWKQGRTLIVVTHDKNLAARADRVVEIKDGLVTRDSSQKTTLREVAPLAGSEQAS
ncbi:ABC transporter ATP-binding protein [Acidobacteriota bacterium]